MKWIFGSASRDIGLMHGGGLLALLLAFALPAESRIITLGSAFTLMVIDTGHMYTTVWRTLFRSEERRSRRGYLIAPALVFALCAAWSLSGLPGLLRAVLYTTIYHHARQYYGMVRWYEKINKRSCRPSHFFIHALFFEAMAIFHVRPDAPDSLFSRGDLFLHRSADLHAIFLVIYAATALAWALYEVRLYRQGLREFNRLLAIAVPVFVTGCGLILGRSVAQILVPAIALHGITYFALMSQSLARLDRENYPGVWHAAFVVVGSALLAGSFAHFVDQRYLEMNYQQPGFGLAKAMLLAAYLTPTICHYIFDAWIWTGKHREARVVFA